MAAIIIIILLFYVFMKEPIQEWRKSNVELPNIRRFILLPFVIIIPIFLVNYILPSKQKNTPQEWIEYGELFHIPEMVNANYAQLIKNDSTNLELHYGYALSFHDLRGWSKQETFPKRLYERYSHSSNPKTAAIGNICLVMQMYNLDEFGEAEKYLDSLAWKMKYKHYLRALLYQKNGEYEKAKERCFIEIANKGFIKGATIVLSESAYFTENERLIDELFRDEELVEFIPGWLKSKYYFEKFKILDYVKQVLIESFKNINPIGFIAALLVSILWLIYLRKTDIYEPENWKFIVLVFLGGFVFTLGVYPLSHILYYKFNFSLDGGIYNDFLYCVIGIGMVEELVKIIPLLLILKFSKEVNEPYDYIFFASVSALGFAWNENVSYYEEGKLHIIHTRALIPVVAHMFFSSLFAYGLMLNKFRYNIPKWLNFVLFWFLAAFFHGFYDYWLINHWANQYEYLTTLFFIISIHWWVMMKNNALNNSVFLDYNIKINNYNLRQFLIFGISSIVMLEYMYLSWQRNDNIANSFLSSISLETAFFMAYLSTNFSRFRLIKGHWSYLKLPDFLFHPFASIAHNHVGMRIKISRHIKSQFFLPPLPITGVITERKSISGDPGWYLVKLDRPIKSEGYKSDEILIRKKKLNKNLNAKGGEISILLIPEKLNSDVVEFKANEFTYLGKAIVQKQSNS